MNAFHLLMNPGLAGEGSASSLEYVTADNGHLLDGSSRVLLMDSRQLAISGGRKLRLGSQFGSILDTTVQVMQKRIAVILVTGFESREPKVEAMSGMLPVAINPSAT